MGQRILAALLIFWASGASAEAVSPERPPVVETFPSAREFYYPLLADPTELGYSGRYLWRVGGGRFGEVTIGDYVGLLRWQLPGDWQMQFNIGGGVLARFNLETVRDSLEVADYTATMPFDFHHGDTTIRAGYWHTSSHLGDDFIKENSPVLQKRSNDLVKAVYSYTPARWLRIYGGGSYALNIVNITRRGALQGGLELLGPGGSDRPVQLFFAQDFQSFERVGWNPSYTMRAGIRGTNSKHIGAARLFVEYFTGHYYFLQRYEQRESRWGAGLSFEIGGPTK